MTEKDRIIQELRGRVAELEEMLEVILASERLCRYCAYLDADCSPTGECHPKLRGM